MQRGPVEPNHPDYEALDLAIQMRALADSVISGNLCGLLFPAFIDHLQNDQGHESPHLIRQIATQVHSEFKRGNRYTPERVASILREHASRVEIGE